jgi:DNA polymerase III delta subunit
MESMKRQVVEKEFVTLLHNHRLPLTDEQKNETLNFFSYNIDKLKSFVDKLALYKPEGALDTKTFYNLLGGKKYKEINTFWEAFVKRDIKRMSRSISKLPAIQVIGFLNYKMSLLLQIKDFIKGVFVDLEVVTQEFSMNFYQAKDILKEAEEFEETELWEIYLRVPLWDAHLKNGVQNESQIKMEFITLCESVFKCA